MPITDAVLHVYHPIEKHAVTRDPGFCNTVALICILYLVFLSAMHCHTPLAFCQCIFEEVASGVAIIPRANWDCPAKEYWNRTGSAAWLEVFIHQQPTVPINPC